MTRTLVVTVESDTEFEGTVRSAIEGMAEGETIVDGEAADTTHTVSFPSEELLAETFTPTTMALLRTVAEQRPGSIRATARAVERDVKNVHEDLTRLEAMGIVELVEEGQAKRPVFPYDELVITVPFARTGGDGEDRVVVS